MWLSATHFVQLHRNFFWSTLYSFLRQNTISSPCLAFVVFDQSDRARFQSPTNFDLVATMRFVRPTGNRCCFSIRSTTRHGEMNLESAQDEISLIHVESLTWSCTFWKRASPRVWVTARSVGSPIFVSVSTIWFARLRCAVQLHQATSRQPSGQCPRYTVTVMAMFGIWEMFLKHCLKVFQPNRSLLVTTEAMWLWMLVTMEYGKHWLSYCFVCPAVLYSQSPILSPTVRCHLPKAVTSLFCSLWL